MEDKSNAAPGTPPAKPHHKHSRSMRALRAMTKGPRLLASHVKHVLRDELYIDVKYRSAPKEVNRELASLELLAAYHLWLRGVVAFFAIAVFILSLVGNESSLTLVNWTIFVVSQATILVIVKVYQVKAQSSGLTNVIFKNTRNIFNSPYFFQMVLEIVIWNIQTPPIVLFWKGFWNMFNYVIFIRLYTVVIYLNHAAYVRRTFCRAMAALSCQALSTSFLLRGALIHRKMRTVIIFSVCGWLSLSFMFARAEQCSIGDAMWYTFQSIGTVGYGDITPATPSGRFITFLCYIFFLVAAGYGVALFQSIMSLSNNEHNLHGLIRCNKLATQVRYDAARVIQRTWRLHRARCQEQTKMQQAKVLIQSWVLTHYIALMSRHRAQFQEAQRQFKESNFNTVTGLSGYQQNEYMQHIQRVAQRSQKHKDAHVIYTALTQRARLAGEAGGSPATPLSRDDVYHILGVPGSRGASEYSGTPAMTPIRRGASMSFMDVISQDSRIQEVEEKSAKLQSLLQNLSQSIMASSEKLLEKKKDEDDDLK